MASTWSASAISLAPPERWREFTCAACGARDRRPVPPDDGLCHACRQAAAERAERERLRALRRDLPRHLRAAGVPELCLGFHRRAWERAHGSWKGSRGGPARLVGWPVSAPGPLLLIHGDAELATFLGTAVFGEALCAGHEGRWYDAADWLRRIRRAFDDADAAEPAFESLAEAGIALVSGLGAATDGFGGLTAWSRSQLAELITYRRMRCKPTILTARMRSWHEIRRLDASLRNLDVALTLKVE